MSIIHDSDRALKRRWFAKKQLGVIKDMELPAKRITWEGFNFKVWQLDGGLDKGGLEGGRITSPMGAVALCMHNTQEVVDPDILSVRFSAFVADFWMGPINHKNYMNNLVINPSSQQVASGGIVRADASGYEIQPFKLVPTQTDKMTNGFGGHNPATKYQDVNATPRALPYMGETFWTGGGGMHWYDPDGNGYYNEFKWVTEILFNFYSSDASQTIRTAIFQEVGELGFVYPSRIYPGMPKLITTEVVDGELVEKEFSRYGHIHTVDYDRSSGDDAIIGNWFDFNHNEIRNNRWFLSNIVQGVTSSTLRDLMNDEARPHGNYQFAVGHDGEVQQVHAMNCWYDPIPTAGVNSEFSSFFSSNPSYEGYKYSIWKWANNGSIYHWTFLDILSLLETLADNTIETAPGVYDMEVVHYMMGQLFPFPNDNWTCAFDSVMFHSHSSNVYTWSRHYGAVKISDSGISQATIYLPTIVTGSNGVRPDIAYAGGTSYTLIAAKPGKLSEPFQDSDWVGVKGVFVGTPFAPSSWTQLPSPPAGYRLRMARPVNTEVIDEAGHPREGEAISTSFLGIAEQYQLLAGETQLPQYVFRLCFIYYVENQDTLVWEGEWQLLSPVPLADVDWHDQFDVSLFGIGPAADQLRDHPDPPDILSTMPVQPYNNYIAAGYP